MENQPTPEQQATVGKAVKEVSGLYLGDQLSMMLGTQGVEARDEAWTNGAKEYPVFEAKIAELRERMKMVAETKKAYPPNISAMVRIPFSKVGDEMARGFLGDVLFSRITESQGHMDYGINMATESQAMAVEMGIKDGWRSAQATGVTLESAIGATLIGTLRVSHVAKK